MKNLRLKICACLLLTAINTAALAQAQPAPPNRASISVRVTADNFIRAESDAVLTGLVARGSFGKFYHNRELTPIDSRIVQRANRDTLYSTGVFDLDAGPVTVRFSCFLPHLQRFRKSFAILILKAGPEQSSSEISGHTAAGQVRSQVRLRACICFDCSDVNHMRDFHHDTRSAHHFRQAGRGLFRQPGNNTKIGQDAA